MSSKPLLVCALAALFCGSACTADDTEMPEVSEFAQEPAAEKFRASYECAGGEEIYEFTADLVEKRGFGWDDADDFYCLTRCEGHDELSRARQTAVHDPSDRTDSWCLSYAAYFCARLDRELESWCWGTREEEEDEDDEN